MARTRARQEHDYARCDDPDCTRFPCRVYREGWQHGYAIGHAEGEAEAYPRGFADGLAACPGPHGGK
jgi:hypothetical protein